MRSAFGKIVGSAARVKIGQKLISIHTDPANYTKAKDALRKASMKFPTPCSITVDRGNDLILGL
jgi:large subunit ribosomal protein L10e